MSSPRRGMRLGFVEPHLRRFGGIRRMIEFANRLTARGHLVTFYLPDDVEQRCTWMRCDATVKPIKDGFGDELDVVLFSSEPHWHLLDRFERARRRVFYALHYAHLYGKEGSWESVRGQVDLQLANSNWTADQILAETGSRPVVQLGGVNREVFHPYPAAKKLTLLTNGERGRAWKGTETVLEAGRLLGIRVESYAGKNLEQPELGRRVRGGARLRSGQLVRRLLPAGARIARVRDRARHDRQRWMPRVRDRRRDRARGAAARRPGDGRGDPAAARRRRSRQAARRERPRRRRARLRLGAANRRVRDGARRRVREPCRPAALTSTGRTCRARDLDRRTGVGQPSVHTTVRRVGTAAHRRCRTS